MEVDIISAEPFHDSEDKYNFSWKTTRVSRGVFGLTAQIVIGEDIDAKYKV